MTGGRRGATSALGRPIPMSLSRTMEPAKPLSRIPPAWVCHAQKLSVLEPPRTNNQLLLGCAGKNCIFHMRDEVEWDGLFNYLVVNGKGEGEGLRRRWT